MHDYLAPMFGDTGATIAQFVITLVVVLLVILLVFWLIRTFTNGSLGTGPARGRQPRLAVLDALPLDQRRRLILIRRDNVEHLILIGGPSDVVVEPNIQRAPQQTRRLEPIRQEPSRPEPSRPEPVRQDVPRPEAQRPEPPRPEPAPARSEPAQARSTPQGGRSIPAAPIEPASVRQPETRRADMTPAAEVQPVDASAPVETPPRRTPPVFNEESEALEERAAEAPFADAVEPDTGFEPVAPKYPVSPAQPDRTAPEPRTGRGFPSFLSGNRPRHTPTSVEIPPESAPAPRVSTQQAPLGPIEGRPTGQRPRPYDPRPLLGSQQTPVAPMDPVRGSPRRPILPPVAAEADPFAGLDDEAERLARFEPIFDVGPETTSTDDGHLFGTSPRSDAPAVEAPQPEDAPVAIAEDFVEAPLPPQDASDSEPTSSVGDLEKEMARLLGEISNSRKS